MSEQDETPQTPLAEGGDPRGFTVDEVNAYLADADQDERDRVLGLEDGEGGKARTTIQRTWEPQEGAQDGTEDQPVTETKATTFQDAAKAATPDTGAGVVGSSPEAERTGRRDKGLSQRNPAILSGGPVPDSRQGVDDSAGLAALADLEG